MIRPGELSTPEDGLDLKNRDLPKGHPAHGAFEKMKRWILTGSWEEPEESKKEGERP